MAARTPVLLNVQPSSFSGWGTVALNLFLEWAGDAEWFPVGTVPFDRDWLVIDGLRRERLGPLIAESQRLQDDVLRDHAGATLGVNIPVLHATGHGFHMARAAHGTIVRGRPNVGLAVLEYTRLDAAAVEAARAYSLIVTASRWNEELLRAAGVEHVRTVPQGIDATLFHPAAGTGWLRDRFVVFSGGKLEHRKAQDIVVRAFRAFAGRHPESLLVTAWHSPWPQFARSLSERGSAAPVPFDASGRADVKGWALANGIAAEQVIDLGTVPNALMPATLREAHVALFPSRAEGGTNLVAMEAMACGVPCILSRNTGHRDIMTAPGDPAPNCYALERQTAVADVDGSGTDGWGESDVEEVIEALETVWRDRDDAAARGARAAADMRALSWAACAAKLKKTVLTEC